MREARNAAAISTSLVKRLPQDPTNIFHCMVAIDFEIAFRRNLEIEMSVPRQLGQHVIKKRNAGPDLIFPRAVEIEAYTNIGFICLPRLCRFAWIHDLFSKAWSNASRNLLFSSGVPIETLRQRSRSGYELTSRTSTP